VIAGAVLGALLALCLLLALLWWLLAGPRADEKQEDAKVVLGEAKSEVAAAPAAPLPRPPPCWQHPFNLFQHGRGHAGARGHPLENRVPLGRLHRTTLG